MDQNSCLLSGRVQRSVTQNQSLPQSIHEPPNHHLPERHRRVGKARNTGIYPGLLDREDTQAFFKSLEGRNYCHPPCFGRFASVVVALCGEFDQLEHLNLDRESISVSENPQGVEENIEQFDILNAPSLHSVNIECWEGSILHIPPPWSALKTFTVGNAIPEDIVRDVIEICPSLQVLLLIVYGSVDESDDEDERTIIHHHLKSLVLEYVMDTPATLLSMIRTPAVEVLTLDLREVDDIEEDEAEVLCRETLRFIENCGSNLTSVRLHHCIFQESVLLGILSYFSKVSDLTISGLPAALSFNVFRALSLPTAPGVHTDEFLCPSLRYLTLEVNQETLPDADQRLTVTLDLIKRRAELGICKLSMTSDAWVSIAKRRPQWERRHLDDDLLLEVLQMERMKKAFSRRVEEFEVFGVGKVSVETHQWRNPNDERRERFNLNAEVRTLVYEMLE